MQKKLSKRIFWKKSNNGLTRATVTNFFLLIAAIFLTLPHQHAFAAMADHQAALDLVPLSAVNREVVQNGPWSNPATWSGGILPKADENIYVPIDKSLTIDIESDLNYNTIRADGVIKFATNKNVKIKLDTLVVTENGTFEIGAETQRVPSDVNIKIYIANNGPIDRNWDPSNISRGVILQGKTRIYGSEKSAFHELSVKPAAGSTQIKLTSVPTGWMKGDVIAITATKFRKKLKSDTFFQTEDELRTIKAISGNIITLGKVSNASFSEPLSYSHVPAISKMPVFAANLTRNVVFSGEGGDAVPASQRGHFMVMHNPDTVIKGASFNFFGRTDKSKPLNDFKLNDNGFRLTDNNSNYIPDSNTNPRGRYAVHFHHTGTNINTPPVICSGNAVFSSKGWGFVNHTSNVVMENNASYNVFGSHFVSEDGNEMGSFKHNIAIKSEGRDTVAKTGIGNHDHGHTGHGFWLQSRNLVVEDNVISGVNNSGLVYYHRNVIKGINLDIPWQNLQTNIKSIVKGMPTIYFSRIPIIDDINNTVLSSGAALNVVKAKREQEHDVRNIFKSLKAYSVVDGLILQYTERYTFIDLEIVADSSTKRWDRGVNVSTRDRDVAFINAKISGFVHPFITGTRFNREPDETDVVFVNSWVDGKPIDPVADIHEPENETISNYNSKIHKTITLIPGNVVSPSLIRPSSTFDLPTNLSDGFSVVGTKSDSLGDIDFESKWKNDSLLAYIQRGYYVLPDGSKCILIPDVISDRLTGETKIVNTRLKINKTYYSMGPLLGNLEN
jgi:G8 domain